LLLALGALALGAGLFLGARYSSAAVGESGVEEEA